MIERCQEQDRERILKYVGDDYGRCLYLYLDFLEYGTEPPVTVWRETAAANRTSALALCFGTTCHLYSRDGAFDAVEWAAHMRRLGVKLVCAERPVVEKLARALPGKAEFGWEGLWPKGASVADRTGIRPVRAEDFGRLAALLHAEGHYDRKTDVGTLERTLRANWARGFIRNYVCERGGEIAAHIATKAESAKFAVAGALVVEPRFRRQGIGMRMIQALCADLNAEGKDVFAFYYDDVGQKGDVHLGFVQHCAWGRLFIKREGSEP